MKKFILFFGILLFTAGCGKIEPAQKTILTPGLDGIKKARAINTSSRERAEEMNQLLDVKAATEIKMASPVAKTYLVTRVIDGDTIDVSINQKNVRVRLIGINTPETVDPRRPVECFGQEASKKAKELLLNKMVSLEMDISQSDKDKYGRLLRYVRVGDVFVNLEMITQGFAYEYTYITPYKYQKSFKLAQAEARTAKRGLWADGICGQKNSTTKIISVTSTTSSISKTCLIKGNISSKKEKIYHIPNCVYYKKTVINPTAGEEWFCSEAEAKAAGFRKALNCT